MVFIDKFYRIYTPYKQSNSAFKSASPNENTLKLSEDGWDGLSYKISNVKEGTKPSDVATISQTFTKVDDVITYGNYRVLFMESKNKDTWMGKKRKISDLLDGVELTDASTVGQTLTRKNDVFVQGENKFQLMESENNVWNAKKQKISNLLEGTKPNDAVTLNQILTRNSNSFVQGDKTYQFMELQDGWWNAHGCHIKNILPGVAPYQAATICQVPIDTPDGWDFKGKNIINVAAGVKPTDAIVKSQVISLNKNKFDATGKQIKNVKAGSETGDVAIIDQLFKKVENGKYLLNGEHINLLQSNDDVWDAKCKIIENVKPGTNSCDVATCGQLLKRVGGNVVSLNGEEFSILQLNKNVWDCKNLRISQVQGGVLDNDVCIMKQLKDLKNLFPNLLVADSEVGLKTLSGQPYKPKGFVYHNERGNTLDVNGRHITCRGNIPIGYGK